MRATRLNRGMTQVTKAKSFDISMNQVLAAFEKVKANKGGPGIDGQTIEQFEDNLLSNLYKICNRMASGSYMPPPVKRVEIVKDDGRMRQLGIPTVADRVAQMVAKQYFEPTLELVFHADSYGYRPKRSAHMALDTARKRCWQFNWVLDFDIKGFFDNIDHGLMMELVRKHTDCKWLLLYIERWLQAPIGLEDGSVVDHEKGTPQGAVISPLLANLYLHYTFDAWMGRTFPHIPFERYADDAICHCPSEGMAQLLHKKLKERMAECKLELHPVKTKIVYCRDDKRRQKYLVTKFTFLGYTFRPRSTRASNGKLFLGFNPAVSDKAAKGLRKTMRAWRLHRKSDLSLEQLAKSIVSQVRGWCQYYGRFRPSVLAKELRTLDAFIVRWAQRKYKRYKGHVTRTWEWLKALRARQPDLFVHWTLLSPIRMTGAV
jgi:RNA-directed DNA polymerase